MNSFVLLLAGNLENILEASFFLIYNAHIQPSEIDNLTTYEFEHYINYLKDYLKTDREREVDLARLSRVGGLISKQDNIS